MMATAQASVENATGWVATVDEATQQIVLRWHPSSTPRTMGYHICTGDPCTDYDTVFGRLDTTLVCPDHSPLEQHTYRLHVFDSSYNVSELTPPFGNIVLNADIPDCQNLALVSWTPRSAPVAGSTVQYKLLARLEPFDEDYRVYYTTTNVSENTFYYTLDIPEAVTRAWLKVQAVGSTTPGQPAEMSQSNIVMAERRTADTAEYADIVAAVYDSINTAVRLALHTDPTFSSGTYTLYRSLDGSSWQPIWSGTSPISSFVDSDIYPYRDSLHCYQLGVTDACDMNERFSATRCVVVPVPLPPAIAFPNVIIANDPTNGIFRPAAQGLKGDIYEFTIYNRNGLQIFYTEDPLAGWTPTADTPQGVYTYFLRLRYNTGDIKTYAGSVILLR